MESMSADFSRHMNVCKHADADGAPNRTNTNSPYRQDRDKARARFNSGEFLEVHVSTSLKTCEERDPKGLYEKVSACQCKLCVGCVVVCLLPDAYRRTCF